MYSKVLKQCEVHDSEVKSSDKNLDRIRLLFITIFILFVIISMSFGIRISIHKSESYTTSISMNKSMTESIGLNTTEGYIIMLLTNVTSLSEHLDRNSTYSMYINTLKEYMSNSEVDLNSDIKDKVDDEITELNTIMSYENTRDYTKMSFDGKKVALYILEQIYKICGLKITYNTLGVIERISTITGKVIYSYSNTMPDGIKVNAAIATLTFMIVLLLICIIIARKTQLFIKEVVYDGFDEERFA